MIFKDIDKSKGQVSRLLLVLAIIILVAVVITYLILKMAEKPQKPEAPMTTEVPMPVYEKQLGDIRFIFKSAIDRGVVLKTSQIVNKTYSSYKKDFDSSGGKFIQVTIGAQNKGTQNTAQRAWDIENIVDSENREFVSLADNYIKAWLPEENFCGALLKPQFEPVSCTKMYEVSKESTGLKIRVITGKDNAPNNLSSDKTDSFLIDLIVK